MPKLIVHDYAQPGGALRHCSLFVNAVDGVKEAGKLRAKNEVIETCFTWFLCSAGCSINDSRQTLVPAMLAKPHSRFEDNSANSSTTFEAV